MWPNLETVAAKCAAIYEDNGKGVDIFKYGIDETEECRLKRKSKNHHITKSKSPSPTRKNLKSQPVNSTSTVKLYAAV